MTKNLFKTISYINLYSSKNKELLAFYRDVLGVIPLLNQDENSHWYGFQTEGVTLAIEPETNRAGHSFEYNHKNPILIQFKAQDAESLEKMNQQLESNGVALLNRSKKKSYGTITNFVDPDGNLLEILL